MTALRDMCRLTVALVGVLAFLTGLPGVVVAEVREPEVEPVAAARAAWDVGEPAAAAASWEDALVLSGPHPDIYFNLGLAYLEGEDWPRAVLNFERSLALEPGQGDATGALDTARTRLHESLLSASTERGVTQGEPRDLVMWRIFRSFGTHVPSWILLGTWLFAFGGLIGRRWIRTQAVRDAMLVAVLLAGVTAALAAGYLVGQWVTDDVRPAVVVDTETGLFESPTEIANTSRPDDLYRGALVTILDDRGDWLQVELVDGTRGWMMRSTVADVRVDKWPEVAGDGP